MEIGAWLPAERRPRCLDGALGTELERAGVRCDLPLWSARALLEAPEAVLRVHEQAVSAGAELLIANTFRTQTRTLARAGVAETAATLTERAVALAREAAQGAGREVLVLGSCAPLEDCFRPDLVPEEDALRREHAEHHENLARAGVSAAIVETMNTAAEARCATRAAREAGLPALVSFTCTGGARLPSGEPLAEALDAVIGLEPLAVGVNCLPAPEALAALPILVATGLPIFAYPNLGHAAGAGGPEPEAPEDFVHALEPWIVSGAAFVGGCCGTTPLHIAALARRLGV